MKNLRADAYLNSILDLTPQFLEERGLKGVILDIDNTLIGHNVPTPDIKILAHLRELENNGIKLCVVSNNSFGRVRDFCEKIGVETFVYDALKPRLSGYLKAQAAMGLKSAEIAAIGDQLFTDVWGAKRSGCYAVLTKPLHKGGEGAFIAFKRVLEKPFLHKKFR
ncbi:MAG: YqeG family HAD IIIA-type phosphatase [Clostridia bacterium]|nr:YqeG family HAD IIIA-type phosphatase [Clostridia bacterium]